MESMKFEFGTPVDVIFSSTTTESESASNSTRKPKRKGIVVEAEGLILCKYATYVHSIDSPEVQEALAKERERFQKRAQRFAIDAKEPPSSIFLANQKKRKRYLNPAIEENSVSKGFDVFDKDNLAKLNERKQRFQISSQTTPPIDTSTSTAKLETREPRRDPEASEERRFDTLTVYGTDYLSTKDIFTYFKDYAVSAVEWINDSSCNAVFVDAYTAKRALYFHSRELTPQESKSEDTDKQSDGVDAQFGYNWRRGLDYKNRQLLLRYATGTMKTSFSSSILIVLHSVNDKRTNMEQKSAYLWVDPKIKRQLLPKQSAPPSKEQQAAPKPRTKLKDSGKLSKLVQSIHQDNAKRAKRTKSSTLEGTTTETSSIQSTESTSTEAPTTESASAEENIDSNAPTAQSEQEKVSTEVKQDTKPETAEEDEEINIEDI
jgi:hypothetical protein